MDVLLFPMMSDSRWLAVSSDCSGDIVLETYPQRLAYALHLHTNGSGPMLPTIVFTGGASKLLLLNSLFKLYLNTPSFESDSSQIHLHLVNNSFMVADVSSFSSIEVRYSTPVDRNLNGNIFRLNPLHEMENCTELSLPSAIRDAVVGRLLAPFSDLICIFSEDEGGISGVLALLGRLCSYISMASTPLHRPTIIVFVTDSDALSAQQLLRESFDEVITVYLEKRTRSGKKTKIIRDLLGHAQSVQRKREEQRLLFSRLQYAAIFDYACQFFAHYPDKHNRFNFVEWSRYRRPVPKMKNHILTLLDELDGVEISAIAVPLIVSSIILDSRPPGMHGKDNPTL